MAWNARELARGREGCDLLQELAEEQDASVALRRLLEALALDHEGCGERRSKLQANLDEFGRQLIEAKESLKVAQAKGDTLTKEVRKLKVEVRWLGKRGDELAE